MAIWLIFDKNKQIHFTCSVHQEIQFIPNESDNASVQFPSIFRFIIRLLIEFANCNIWTSVYDNVR